MEHIKSDIYIKLDAHVRVDQRQVRLKDMASIYCSDEELTQRVKNVTVFSFQETDGEKEVISILYVYEAIYRSLGSDLQIHSTGSSDCLVDLISGKRPSGLWSHIQVVLVSLVTFFGAAFSIMTFNTDVDTAGLFDQISRQLAGGASQGGQVLKFFYSLGIGVGVIFFFNHFGHGKITQDPTPIEVQMRTYEEDVDKALIAEHDRQESPEKKEGAKS